MRELSPLRAQDASELMPDPAAAQAFDYFRSYGSDRMWIKVMVASLVNSTVSLSFDLIL